jgi:hypothetical protein
MIEKKKPGFFKSAFKALIAAREREAKRYVETLKLRGYGEY